MTFWMTVAATYAGIVAVGLGLGSLLASRFPRRGGNGGQQTPEPAPYGGPSLALGDVPPLGSDFDRELLPGAFAEVAPTR
jgi:hypothetical protein